MEQDFGLDLEEVGRAIDTADVLIVRFKMIDQRLLVDSRHDAQDGPLVRLVGRAASVEDRFHSLKELRPRVPLPDKITGFEWAREVAVLQEAGLWQRIEQRLEGAGGNDAVERARVILRELQ